MTYDFPGKGKVAVLKTRPETVVDDFGQVMQLAGYQDSLDKALETILKINISWQTWYPACSTAPWQLEGVIRRLQADGYQNLAGAHNKTVVVDAYVGERNNKHKYVVDKYGVRNVHLYEPEVEWVVYEPKGEMMVLNDIFPDGIKIPKWFIGKNMIQLPTVKTHVFTTITGAMKNAFGGLLSERRHWTHAVIDETLVDLLTIQHEIHPGLFAVMDGTFAGDGPGPRAMRVHEKDIILASADQVAIDAISAKIQGFNPLDLEFIRYAHEKGLGVGDPKDIEIVGYDISAEDWGFIQEDTFASKGQKLIYHGPLKKYEKALLQSPIVPWSYFASNFYHNVYWYPVVGRKRVKEALHSKWGQLFQSYGDGKVVLPGPEPVSASIAAGAGVAAVAGAFLAGKTLLKK
ncbi:MAG TPA: DUF362 domain-containing protein [Thermomicrobiales bacterium]|nr:DUF362 domain-containing protein [Thermomicrobiales bacterium]